MIPITTFQGLDVAVFGLGASGQATAAALMAGGARVTAWDDGEAARAAASTAGIPVSDLKTESWARFAALVLAPGVPLTHPDPHWTVLKAQDAGIEIIGDIELFSRERASVCPAAPFIAITGTNGKSTTTALIAHILKEAGRDVQLGGNIGRAVLTLEPITPQRFYVVECSSFQIDLAPTVNPSVAILLNLTPDHLDRHGTMARYAAIKARLIAGADAGVIVIDDEHTRSIATRLRDEGQLVTTVSTRGAADVTYTAGRILRDGQAVADIQGVGALRGQHNAENAAAACVALRFAGLPDDVIATHMRTYPGLAHRMEEIARIGPVLFVNDSKATNAESTEKALASWEGGIHLILGGKAKDGGIEMLRPYFPRIAKAYLIGDASDAFARTLSANVAFERCGTMEVAVGLATADALAAGRPDSVVLLSPACASFDQYRNFEERGDHFRNLVAAEVAQRSAA